MDRMKTPFSANKSSAGLSTRPDEPAPVDERVVIPRYDLLRQDPGGIFRDTIIFFHKPVEILLHHDLTFCCDLGCAARLPLKLEIRFKENRTVHRRGKISQLYAKRVCTGISAKMKNRNLISEKG